MKLPTIAMAVVVLGAAHLMLAIGPPGKRDGHPDEGLWAACGKRSFELLFLERDVRLDAWSDPSFGPFGAGNPNLGKLCVGASLFASGAVRHGEPIPGYDLRPPGWRAEPAGEDEAAENDASGTTAAEPSVAPLATEQPPGPFGYEWSVLRTRRPPEAILEAARRPLRALAALAPVFLCLLLQNAFGSVLLAGLAGLLLTVRPLFLEQGRLALMDTPALALALASFWMLTDPPGRRARGLTLRRAFVAGAVAGWAGAIKLTGLIAPVVGLVWILLRPTAPADDPSGFEQPLPPGLARARALGAFAVAALASFVLTNPPLLSAPIDGLRPMLALATEVVHYDVPADRRLDGLAARGQSLLASGLAQDAPLEAWLRIPFLEGLLSLLGLAALTHRLRRGAEAGAVFVALWSCAFCALVLATTPFDWRRWYVPMEPVWATMTALGLWTLVRWPLLARAVPSPERRE